jgi:hypothetical protein
VEPPSDDQPGDTDAAGTAPDPSAPKRRGTAGGSMMAAAMLAVGEILEPEKTHVEIAEEAPSDLLDPAEALDLDFGDLPDL